MYASELNDSVFKKIINLLNINEEKLIDMTIDEVRLAIEDLYDEAEYNILEATMVNGQNEIESKRYSDVRNVYSAFIQNYLEIIL